jgi:NAD(P)-dependent dehydrogenase (short-subunit alcohol dehydrogenase family)
MNDLRESFNFTNKVIVLAGGNGFIGSALTKYLSKLNAITIVLDKNIKHSEELQNVHYVESSQNFTQESIKLVIDSIELEYGPISGLVNCMTKKVHDNAIYFSAVADYSLSAWQEIIQGNLDNSFLLCREIGLRMVSRHEGSIINFCSIYGAEMGPDLRIYNDLLIGGQVMTTPIPYSVSKGGIQALTKHLATTWARYGVRVNAISPGGVYNNQNKEFVKSYSSRVPLGRMADIEEIIGLPIFLLSPLSSYITGQNIFVDGGLSAW